MEIRRPISREAHAQGACTNESQDGLHKNRSCGGRLDEAARHLTRSLDRCLDGHEEFRFLDLYDQIVSTGEGPTVFA